MVYTELLNPKESMLLDFLSKIPPDLESAECFLKREMLTDDEIIRVSVAYAGTCSFEVEYRKKEPSALWPQGIVPDLHSTYLLDVLELLLRYGLDPNGFTEGHNSIVYPQYGLNPELYLDRHNIMESILRVDNDFLAADALVLLLEHGGKTELPILWHSETLFGAVDYHIWHDEHENFNSGYFSALIHCWMVLVGYGARYQDNDAYMRVFWKHGPNGVEERFDLSELKNHRKYFFGISEPVRCGGEHKRVHIYEKETLWEAVEFSC